ncbi:MAG TPA: MerR family transcriptional regulator [Acidobacteriaceae bacterium]|nr:MerR family transcriptional regulator [Acidobacteriaceae bacterium]
MASHGGLSSGRLAGAAGVSADTIRHYEKLGLIAKAPRTQSGYRVYPHETIQRVQIIRSAVRVGFSLAELAGIFRERDAGGAPCRRVASLASGKLARLDQQITEMVALREWLAGTVETWQARVRNIPDGARAKLLESLVKQAPPGNRGNNGARR